MEFERRKLLEEMSTKITKKSLNNMAAAAATKEPEYLDEEGNKREPTMRVLSLGAGVQSSCLALMAPEGLTKHKPDYMIFADTGWEPSFVYEHVEYLKKAITIFPIITVERSNIREDLIRAANPVKGVMRSGSLSPDACRTHHCLQRVPVERLECFTGSAPMITRSSPYRRRCGRF